MAVETMPWMVGGGAEHPVELARLLAFVGAGGNEGVATPGSMRVAALPTPGGAVRVAPGAAILLNRYPGGGEQSYAIRNPTATDVAISPTTSAGGRTDLVWARVVDPQYEGAAPPDPDTYEYVRFGVTQGVSPNLRTLSDPRPIIPLALVTLPASTATVTGAMILDLRQLANPQLRRERASTIIPGGQSVAFDKNGAGLTPLNAYTNWQAFCPPWATHVTFHGHYSSGYVNQGRAVGRLGISAFGVPFAEGVAQSQYYDITSSANGSRFSVETFGEFAVPAGARGTNVTFVTNQKIDPAHAGRFVLDGYSAAWLDIEWQQRT